MFESWFTNKCTAFINASGRMLEGEELEAAKKAVKSAELANLKIWTDKDGAFYVKKRSLFASAERLCDSSGNPVTVCNHKVNIQARFCSKCGAPAPGGWWKCSGCGEYIGNDSKTCPHCGKTQSVTVRHNFSNGNWIKNEDVIAEYIDLEDVASKMENGLSVHTNQLCLFLSGGRVVEVLEPGSYSDEQLKIMAEPFGGNRGVVMLDKAEFPVRMCVEKLYSKENIEADLHISLTLRIDSLNFNDFLQNYMGKGLTLNKGSFSSVVTYDEVARNLLQFADMLAREYCVTRTVKEFFCDADVRKELEKHIAEELFDHLKSAGMTLVRLGEVEFESEVFEKLRESAGDLERYRRELEFMNQVRDLENDKQKQETLTENEMADFFREVAKEKSIKEQLYEEEMEQLQRTRQLHKEIRDLELKCDIQDEKLKRANQSRLLQLRQDLEIQKAAHDQRLQLRQMEQEKILLELDFDNRLADARHTLATKVQHNNFDLADSQLAHDQKVEKLTTEHSINISRSKLDSKLSDQQLIAEAEVKLKITQNDAANTIRKNTTLTDLELRERSARTEIGIRKEEAFTNAEINQKNGMVDLEIQKEKLQMELEAKERANDIDLDRLDRLVAIKNAKHDAKQQRNIALLKAADGADITALLMATDDPVLRKQLLELHLQQQKQEMSPEKILALAAAEGNRDVLDALIALSSKNKGSN